MSGLKEILASYFQSVRCLPGYKKSGRKNKHQGIVVSEEHNNIGLICNGIPIPSIRLRDMVRKGAILAEEFIVDGRQVYDCLKEAAVSTGLAVEDSVPVFEFGVGCGRIARHFLAEGVVNFTGSDVDHELIDWCKANLTVSESVRFIASDYMPPLAIASSSQKFIYAISVFTHLPRDAQAAWAEEMERIMAPGGRLFVSFLERISKEDSEGIQVSERIDQEYTRSWMGRNGAPTVYYDSWHTREFLESMFEPRFKVIDYRKRAIRNHQSLLVLIKTNA